MERIPIYMASFVIEAAVLSRSETTDVSLQKDQQILQQDMANAPNLLEVVL